MRLRLNGDEVPANGAVLKWVKRLRAKHTAILEV